MSQFEFFMIIVSVLIAIAISELVGWWGRLIRFDGKVNVDPLHLCWTVAVLIISVTYWIGIWPYAEYDIVHVGQVWALILPTLCLILVTYAITPDLVQNGNGGDYMVDKRRSIFLALAVFLMLAVVADWVFVGFVPSGMLPMLLLAGLYLACACSPKRWIQVFALIVTLLFFIFLPIVLGLEGLFDV